MGRITEAVILSGLARRSLMPNPRAKSKSLRRRKKAVQIMTMDQVMRIGVNEHGQSIHLKKGKPKNKLGQ